MKNKYGFTMIELLVTTTIIAVLTAIGLVSFRTANMKARNAKRTADLQQVRAGLEIYRSDNPTYSTTILVPGDLATIAGLSSYLTSSSVTDPKDPSPAYTYTSDGITYQLCATIEPDDTSYCLSNP